MLEISRLLPGQITCFLHFSTDEVYGESTSSGEVFGEEAAFCPTNPYAASKAAAECLVTAYSKSFGLPTIITRSNNVYGPNQYPEKIIPKFIARLMKNLPLEIHGDGSNSRNYLYCTDVAKAIDLILHNGRIGETYNIGCDDEISNSKLAEMIAQACGAHMATTVHVQNRLYNDKCYRINSDKLRALGWKASVSFEDGLKETGTST